MLFFQITLILRMSRFYKYNRNNLHRKCLVAYINKASLSLKLSLEESASRRGSKTSISFMEQPVQLALELEGICLLEGITNVSGASPPQPPFPFTRHKSLPGWKNQQSSSLVNRETRQ